jgi:hypothetical protein
MTWSGNWVDQIIKQLPVDCTKSNLYDLDYKPDEAEQEGLAVNWYYRVEHGKDDIVVLLGKVVQSEFIRIDKFSIVEIPHPGSLAHKTTEDRKKWVDNAVVKIIKQINKKTQILTDKQYQKPENQNRDNAIVGYRPVSPPEHTHVSIKHGHATFEGKNVKPNDDVLKALESMGEVAYNNSDKLRIEHFIRSKETDFKNGNSTSIIALSDVVSWIEEYVEKYSGKDPKYSIEIEGVTYYLEKEVFDLFMLTSKERDHYKKHVNN